MVSKRDNPNELDRSDEARYDRAVQKVERAKRRRIQDKTKGNRTAESKIKTLEEERDALRERLDAVVKLLRYVVKLLPESLRDEYERYRVMLNSGAIEDVHPE